MDSEEEGEGGLIWENGIETRILSCKNRITSLCLMQDTACLGLVHGDDPEGCYGEGGGRGVHVWERMYTRGGFMSMSNISQQVFSICCMLTTVLSIVDSVHRGVKKNQVKDQHELESSGMVLSR